MFYGVRAEQPDRLGSKDPWQAGEAETAIVNDLPDWIAQIERNGDAGAAFGQLLALTVSINEAIAIRSSIIERIEEYLDKLRTALAAIAGRLGAESFSIGASAPVGLSISVSFGLPK